MKRKSELDIINGPLLPNIMRFSLPLMASGLLQLMFNAADIVVVGQFSGSEALAAVGATGSIVFLLTTLFNGLSIGSNVVIARYIGAKDRDRIDKTVHTSMYLSIVLGIALIFVGLVFCDLLLRIMDTPKDIIKLASLYLKIYFVGMPAMMIYNFGSALLRGKGDTRRPLIFLTISGCLNVALNLFLVIVMRWSVVGVALATVISQALSAILVMQALIRENDVLHLDIRRLSIDKQICLDIVRIGVPAGIQGVVFSISNIVIQASINSFGSVVVAGNSAANNIEGFVYIAMNAFFQACITFTSQNIGANRIDRINKILLLSLGLICVSGIVCGWIAWYFGDFFLGLYSTDAAVIEAGKIRLLYVALTYVLNGIMDAFVGSMRGMGRSIVPTLLTLCGICGFRLIWIASVFPIYHSLQSVYISYPLSWIFASVLHFLCWIVTRKQLEKNLVLNS